MVAQLMRMRWALFLNGMKRNVWQLVGTILGALYVLFWLGLALVGLYALAEGSPEVAEAASTLAMTLVVLGWAIIPVFFTGMDASMEPQRFALLPLSPRALSTGLLAAGFVGVPGLATLLFSVIVAVGYRSDPGALMLAMVCGLLSALVAQVLARLGTTIMGSLAQRRGLREIGSVLLFVPLFLLGPVIAQIAREPQAIIQALPGWATVAGFTPVGAFAGIPWFLTHGQLGSLAIALCIGLATLALGWWGYTRAVRRAIVTPPRIVASASREGLGWIGRFPATAWGAVAGRCVTYWFKDPRYAASLAMVPLMVVIFGLVLPRMGEESTGMMFILGPLIGAILGFAISADISYDSTAFSLHVLTGVRGRDDRLGRVVGLAIVAIPLTLVACIVPIAVQGRMELLPAALGAGLGALLTSAGLASLASARWTYAVPLPGESPFKTPPGTGARMALTQGALFLTILVLCSPTFVLYVLSILQGGTLLIVATLAVGLVLGAVLLWVGIVLGARWYERRAPELMQAVVLNR